MTLALSSPAIAMYSSLSDDDSALLKALEEKVNKYRSVNALRRAYYEGSLWLNKLGFSIPPSMKDFQTVVGWPAIVTDVIEERLKWRGWLDVESETNQIFWDQLYSDNALSTEAPMVHLDSLIYGCGFVSVGTRDPEDPEETRQLIMAEATELTTGVFDPQKRRLVAGVAFRKNDEGDIVRATLYKLNETIYLRRLTANGYWVITDRDQHNLGRLQLIPFINRPTGSRREGRSEITRTICGYTDMGIRTLLGMETNREFFSAPQRYVLNATEKMFRDATGNPIPGWVSLMGQVWGVPRGPNDEEVEVGQFDPAPSRPYLEQIQGIAQLVAADGAVPQTYLGFMSDNPASADSIRALESRLIKRSERRITSFDWSWNEVGYVSWIMKERSRKRPKLDTDWGNPATPTQQADADVAMKLVSVGILLPDSTVTYNRVGLTKAEQVILKKEKLLNEAKQRQLQRQMMQNGTAGTPGATPGTNGQPGAGTPQPAGAGAQGNGRAVSGSNGNARNGSVAARR